MNINWHDKKLTFEEVYPKAEFSELIRLVLVLTNTVCRLSKRLKLHHGHAGGGSQAGAPKIAQVGGDPST